MMEYTVARVVTIMCGVLLVSAVLPPVQSLFDDSETSEMQDQSENICRMIDTFYDSEADEMVISLNSILPNDSSVSMDGYFVTVTDGEEGYRYDTRYQLFPDSGIYGTNDILRFTKDGGTVMVERI